MGAPVQKKSENQALTFCTPLQKDFFAKYYERRKVTGIANAICTRALAGNLSLQSVTANVSNLLLATMKADALKQEWDRKVFYFL